MSRYIDAVTKRIENSECGESVDHNKVIANIKSLPPANQWIPCSERLPDALQAVLVTSTMGHVYISYIVHGNFEYGGDVVAWMPLPEPWKGDSDEQIH